MFELANHVHRCFRLIAFLFAAFFSSALPVRAEFPKPRLQEVSNPYPAVQLTHWEFDRPRPIRAWAARIDLTNPGVELVTTPRTKVAGGFHLLSETTQLFAESNGLQLAINATPFSPLRGTIGEPVKVNGLHISRGELIAPPDPKPPYSALLIAGDNRATIRPYPIEASELAKTRHGVGGFQCPVIDGQNKVWQEDPNFGVLHPRTAVGVSEKGKHLWLLVADGRQPGRSEGMTFNDLAEWALSLGITDLLNLDGGGSTTMVIQDPKSGAHRLVSTPVGFGLPGTLRPNGNNLGVRLYAGPNDLTASHLQAIMPKLKSVRVPLFLGPLNRAMTRFHINTPARRAAFLAQLAHESGELTFMEEIADGKAYEGRVDLGNTEPGDGPRFKGRGPIQLTGRENYCKAGVALGVKLEEEPNRAADPEIGCQVSGWFWDSRGLNELADANDFQSITRRINGGMHGQESRTGYYERAKAALGATTKK